MHGVQPAVVLSQSIRAGEVLRRGDASEDEVMHAAERHTPYAVAARFVGRPVSQVDGAVFAFQPEEYDQMPALSGTDIFIPEDFQKITRTS